MSEETAPALPADYTPIQLRYGLSGWPPSTLSYLSWDKDHLCFGNKPFRLGQILAGMRDEYCPTPDQWRQFWEKCDELEAWSLPSTFGNLLSDDGIKYHLELQFGTRMVSSRGQLADCSNEFRTKVRRIHRALQLLVDWDLTKGEDWGIA